MNTDAKIVSAVINPSLKDIIFTLDDGSLYKNPGYGSTHYSQRYTHEMYYDTLVRVANNVCPNNITYTE
tara:strand:+ start:390 stop:596 length:207 start_codon:yes stop_codon:yes gene_type:complete